MIKRIKLFVNDNKISQDTADLLKYKLLENSFKIVEDKFDLAISIGGDGSFLRMVNSCNFDSNVLYVGINSGTLGFLQEIGINQIDEFIDEIKNEKFKIEEVGIQETKVKSKRKELNFYSLNDIVIRDKNLKVFKCTIKIDDNIIEDFVGDGVLVSTSTGSTAHNLSYGGSIVYNTFTSLQITSIAPINSSVFKTIPNSIIIPDKKIINLIPQNKDLIITVDGNNIPYRNTNNIETTIGNKKIRLLKFSHYNFPQKINEKLINNSIIC